MQYTITVEEDGSVRVEGNGFQGTECVKHKDIDTLLKAIGTDKRNVTMKTAQTAVGIRLQT